MYTALRTLAAILVGMLLALVLVVAVEGFSAVAHPLPEDFGGTPEELYRHVERYPHWVLALVVPAWAVTALVGTWTAKRMGNLCSYAIVGLLLLAALESRFGWLQPNRTSGPSSGAQVLVVGRLLRT